MLRRLTALAVVIAALSVGVAQAQTWSLGKWSPGIHNTQNAIYWAFCGHKYVYCSYGNQAWNVASCETGRTFSIWSANGQYLGLFQMGSRERAQYGHGHDPWKQARSANTYFTSSGRDWSPWDPRCRP